MAYLKQTKKRDQSIVSPSVQRMFSHLLQHFVWSSVEQSESFLHPGTFDEDQDRPAITTTTTTTPRVALNTRGIQHSALPISVVV